MKEDLRVDVGYVRRWYYSDIVSHTISGNVPPRLIVLLPELNVVDWRVRRGRVVAMERCACSVRHVRTAIGQLRQAGRQSDRTGDGVRVVVHMARSDVPDRHGRSLQHETRALSLVLRGLRPCGSTRLLQR
ncbi:hypothetical protein GW17_00021346 [Ensete ventricosum]|nr:hypothetical protein GW17_00021346 [Ensete ventricosum]